MQDFISLFLNSELATQLPLASLLLIQNVLHGRRTAETNRERNEQNHEALMAALEKLNGHDKEDK